MIQFSISILLLSALHGQDKGRKAYESGKYDEARTYYEHILNNRKNDAAAQFGLGATAYKQQDMEIATRSLNAVKNSDDPSLAAKALYNLGNMFRDQQKMAESLAMYRQAIEFDPMDEILFGKNFGMISDMKFGPDGALYVISLMEGKIYRITLG